MVVGEGCSRGCATVGGESCELSVILTQGATSVHTHVGECTARAVVFLYSLVGGWRTWAVEARDDSMIPLARNPCSGVKTAETVEQQCQRNWIPPPPKHTHTYTHTQHTRPRDRGYEQRCDQLQSGESNIVHVRSS